MAWQYWTESPRQGRWRQVDTPTIDTQQQVRIRTTASAISKGTETLVHHGQVPTNVAELMRAPHQLGDFSYPVSYGYLGVGVVDQGPDEWLDKRVFGLLPHHSHHVVDPAELLVIPDDISDHRALLTGAAETAINILWQQPPRYADRIAIVGAGMIGATTALLASRFPLERLEVLETNPARRELINGWGITALAPEDASANCDLVIHVSGHEAGLARALEITGDDGTVIEASWYGENSPAVPLGADFHARRLNIVASQVGQVAIGQRHRRTTQQRQQAGLESLTDARFDDLITGVSAWHELPEVMDAVTQPGEFAAATLCHVFTYDDLERGIPDV